MSAHLLSVEDLRVEFRTHAGVIHAVNGMTFDVDRAEVFGLVGESGCGKSVTGMAVLNMIRHPGSIVGGRVMFDGEDLVGKSDEEMVSVRGRRIAMIFQDPAASLNPVFTIGRQITRLVRLHLGLRRSEAMQRSVAMLDAVGLRRPDRVVHLYPHELSGGMQQRVMIGMALACGAGLIIADEPTTALDVTIQAQILDLLLDLRDRQGVSTVLITHDLAVVAEVCDRVAVVYAGAVIERGTTEQVLSHPRHPYTRGLLAALPNEAAADEVLQVIDGAVPDGLDPIDGCAFRPRCPDEMDICRIAPPWTTSAAHHGVACHHATTQVES